MQIPAPCRQLLKDHIINRVLLLISAFLRTALVSAKNYKETVINRTGMFRGHNYGDEARRINVNYGW
jgi:hypothetical protein